MATRDLFRFVAPCLFVAASSCSAKNGGEDAGTGVVEAVCTSGTYTLGEKLPDTNLMHPGGACDGCHTSPGRTGPVFPIAGTVYSTLHEKDDCNAAASVQGSHVVITGSDGRTLTIAVNATGNFLSAEPVALPLTAKVVQNGNERAMQMHLSGGDCNGCHTEQGALGAPGRITIP